MGGEEVQLLLILNTNDGKIKDSKVNGSKDSRYLICSKFFVKVILNLYCHFKIFELCHSMEEFIRYFKL
jgi:hypothetical protein